MARMSNNRNCPNCGAPIDPYMVHCKYCDTYYFDLSAFDCSKTCFVKFKQGNNVITALAQPRLQSVNLESEYTSIMDSNSIACKTILAHKICTISVDFECCANPENGSMFTVVNEKSDE